MRIEFIYDSICPWCYIGKRRLDEALRRRPGINFDLHWWPYLLNRNMPAAGMARDSYLTAKYGNEARVQRVFVSLQRAAEADGIPYAPDRIRHTPNSVNAHRLVLFANRYDTGNAAVEALFYAYFVNGQDTGDIAVLIDIGRNLGLDDLELAAYLESDDEVAAVHRFNTEAHMMRVEGVPTFLFERRHIIFGAQDSEVLVRLIDLAAAEGDIAAISIPYI